MLLETFANGENITVLVDEKLGGTIMQLDKDLYNNNQKETRRHQSLNEMVGKADTFVDKNVNIEDDFLNIDYVDLWNITSNTNAAIVKKVFISIFFAFETLDATAEKIGTSTTSVIRFCRKLGFSGYKPFQEKVKLEFRYRFSLPEKLKATTEKDNGRHDLPDCAENAIRNIEQTFSGISPKLLAKAQEQIKNADRVFCFGLKESFALSHYAYTRFMTIRNGVFMLSAGQSGEIESVLNLKKGDVCIFFLFHRYTKQSPQVLELVKKQGATVILITSSPYDTVEKHADILIPCFIDINGIKNSAAAPVCIIDFLCNAVVSSDPQKSLGHMKKSEELFKEFTL